jgi:hypothetical protein
MLNNLGLTKREKIVLIALGALLPILIFIPQDFINKYDIVFILVIVSPLGFLIATDPERNIK